MLADQATGDILLDRYEIFGQKYTNYLDMLSWGS